MEQLGSQWQSHSLVQWDIDLATGFVELLPDVGLHTRHISHYKCLIRARMVLHAHFMHLSVM